MDHLTRTLNHWLHKNNLPAEGVKIIIEFPTEHVAHEAEMYVKQEIKPWATMPGFGRFIETMNGIGLSFTWRRR